MHVPLFAFSQKRKTRCPKKRLDPAKPATARVPIWTCTSVSTWVVKKPHLSELKSFPEVCAESDHQPSGHHFERRLGVDRSGGGEETAGPAVGLAPVPERDELVDGGELVKEEDRSGREAVVHSREDVQRGRLESGCPVTPGSARE